MEEKVQRIIKSSGALQEGHFILTSGLHSEHYVEKFKFLQPKYLIKLVKLIKDNGLPKFDAICGPTTGGALLAYELSRQTKKPFYLAEKDEEKGRVIKRGDYVEPGTRFVLIDDVLTTGGSLRDTARAVIEAGGDVVKIQVIVKRAKEFDRMPTNLDWFTFRAVTDKAEFKTALLHYLTLIDLPAYEENECPHCNL